MPRVPNSGVCVCGGGGEVQSMLEQRIDEKTINSVFRVSVKTTPFRCVVCESAPYYCLANFDCRQQRMVLISIKT